MQRKFKLPVRVDGCRKPDSKTPHSDQNFCWYLQEVPMSYKFASLVHTTLAFLQRSQARIGLVTFIQQQTQKNSFEMKKRTKNEAPKRIKRLEARVTEAEYEKIEALSKECGLSVSEYTRQVAFGQHPRKRLDDHEIDALCSLSDARADLIKIAAAVKSIQSDKRGLVFKDPAFVERWMRAAVPLIQRWSEIIIYMKN